MLGLLSPREPARKLGKDVTLVYRHVKAGRAPSVRVQIEVIRVPWDQEKGAVGQGQ